MTLGILKLKPGLFYCDVYICVETLPPSGDLPVTKPIGQTLSSLFLSVYFSHDMQKHASTVPWTPHAEIWAAWHASGVRTVHPVNSYGGIAKIDKFKVFYNSQWWELHSQMVCWYGALLHFMRGPGDSRSFYLSNVTENYIRKRRFDWASTSQALFWYQTAFGMTMTKNFRPVFAWHCTSPSCQSICHHVIDRKRPAEKNAISKIALWAWFIYY